VRDGNLLVTAVIALAAYGAFDLLRRIARFAIGRRNARAQEVSDEEAFWTYKREHETIRARFDPAKTWNEATSPPEEYVSEIRALNLRFSGMLRRRNGWTDKDFDENGHNA